MFPSIARTALSECAIPAPSAVVGEAGGEAAAGGGETVAREQRRAGDSDRRQRTVLIVENEDNNRRLVEQILDFAGYAHLSATNGIEALELLGREQVDVVLIDLSMPILDGYRTTELIRLRPECAALPIVAVTAHAMSEDRELALRAGCTEYLAKPFRPNELLTVVARMLDEADR
jgi:CheY-like chemotaxis protein